MPVRRSVRRRTVSASDSIGPALWPVRWGAIRSPLSRAYSMTVTTSSTDPGRAMKAASCSTVRLKASRASSQSEAPGMTIMPSPWAMRESRSGTGVPIGFMRASWRRAVLDVSSIHPLSGPHIGETPQPEPQSFGSPLGRCLLQRGRQLAARADAELAVRVAEVHLDRLRRHVEDLGDLAVRLAGGGQVDDAALARGERLDAA